MFPYRINDQIELRILTLEDAETMFALIQKNREHLDQWLRWSGRVQKLEDAQKAIQRFVDKWAAQDGFHAGIYYENQLAGGLVCHSINRESRKSEIGYWLAKDFVGYGLAIQSSKAALKYLFEHEKLNRVEIQCAVDNVRSRAIPEKLGFKLEGILRESEWITDHFADHALYAMLAKDWLQTGTQ